ncbi:helix-turn-helix transcriptional regulator [Jatrophihabitans sp. YIM 134969]
MAARRAERLVNLVIALLSTRQYLTAEQLRSAVPGYEADDGSERADEAFKRMFERDKAELRDLGIPLETGRTSIMDVEDGYRIPRRDYELPTVDFDPAEAAAVGLAARLWQSATLGAPARTALMKLRAGGTALDPDDAVTPPTVDASDPALAPLLTAVRERRVVTFSHRSGGDSDPITRHVEPWGVLSWSRRWYLVGYDRDRDAPRSFRLSRVEGTVTVTRTASTHDRPADLDMVAMVAGRSEWRRESELLVAPGRAGRLRRAALRTEPGVDGAPDRLVVDFADTRWLAREIASAGTGVEVLGPDDVVAAVRDVLQSTLEAHGAAGP